MTDLVLLQGQPSERGEAMGRAQADMLKRSIEEFRKRCATGGVDPSELPDRARQLTTLVNSLVPEWIIEARAAAAGAGIPVATFLGMSSTPDVMHEQLAGPLGEGSTAFAAVGHTCLGARAVIHFNRDGRRMPQFAISRAASPGTLAYVGLSGGAELGVHAFVNESGLAGCWLAGPTVRDPGSGLRPQVILRALAERSVNCQQAIGYFSELQSRYGLYTPGDRGVTFLLADASGEMVQIEARSLRFVQGVLREGVAAIANQFQLPDSPGGPQARDVARQRRLREHALSAPLDAVRSVAFARLTEPPGDRGVCNENTVAGFTAVLGSQGCPGWAVVSLGSPGCVQPVALFPGAGVPLPMLDGSAWSAAENIFARYGAKGVPAERHANVDRELAQALAPLAASTVDEPARAALVDRCYKLLIDFMDDAQAP